MPSPSVQNATQTFRDHGGVLKMADAVRAVASRLNPRGIEHCFEVYGFDFMVDASFRAWISVFNGNGQGAVCFSSESTLGRF